MQRKREFTSKRCGSPAGVRRSRQDRRHEFHSVTDLPVQILPRTSSIPCGVSRTVAVTNCHAKMAGDPPAKRLLHLVTFSYYFQQRGHPGSVPDEPVKDKKLPPSLAGVRRSRPVRRDEFGFFVTALFPPLDAPARIV